jgi:putative mRNA 3-end processing factor
MMMLKDLKFPIFVDGMGIRATRHILSHPDSFLNARELSGVFRKVHSIGRKKERAEALKKPSVIITTAGMLQGGPAGFYIKKLLDRKDCAMVLTGYQVEGTPGRNLVETGIYSNEGIEARPQFPVHFLDFSAHTDRSHLIQFYRHVNPQKIILVHGDRTVEFAEELKGMGFDAVAPKNGDIIKV